MQFLIPPNYEALAMEPILRAPFHHAAVLRARFQHTAWRTVAGCPDATGTNDGPGVAARFSQPSGIAVDASSGIIYVADSGNHTIRLINPAGTVSTLAGQPGISGWQDGSATSALFDNPGALALGTNGDLYVADRNNYVIRRIDAAGIVSTVAGQPGMDGYRDGTGTNALFGNDIGGLALDKNGDLYVADGNYNYVIRKISAEGTVSTLAGQPGNNGYQDGTGTNALFGDFMGGLTLDSQGNLYVADRMNCVIRKITPAGVVTTWVGAPDRWGYLDGHGTNAWFAGLRGLATDSQDNLYATETDNRCVRKVSPDGEVSTLGGDVGIWDHRDGIGPFTSFKSCDATAFDPSGHLLVVDSGDSTIRYGSVEPEPTVQVLSQPAGKAVQEGASVTISVLAQSASSLTYQWLHNGQLIPGRTNTSLVLENVQEADAGQYRVAVSDGVGYTLSFPASLEVQPATTAPLSLLDNWRPLASLPLQQIHGLAYGNGQYVAVSDANPACIATSTDGVHWVKQFPISSESLNSVAFGNGLFVIVGNHGAVFTSTNGLAWEAQTLTPEGMPDLRAIAFGQGIFVAVSGDANGSIWTSPDGNNWTNRGVDFGVTFMAVNAEGGKFIAVGNTIMVSTNGLDWEPVNVPANYLGQEILLEHIACANGALLAAQHSGGFVAASSTGLDWQDITPTNELLLSRVTYGNGQFMAVDMNSGGVSLSSDGMEWGAPAVVSDGERSCSQPHLCFEDGIFVASGDEGALFTSSDGSTWTLREQQQAIPFVPNTMIEVEGQYFGAGGQGVEVSSNGLDWNLLVPTDYFNCCAYGGGSLVAVGGGEQILTSQDGGATWTDRSPHLSYGARSPYLSRMTYGEGVFVAVGSLHDDNNYPVQRGHILASSNLVNWVAKDYAPTNSLSDVTYGNGLFVALLNWSRRAEILTSTNGFSWKTAATFPNTWLGTVAYGNGRFVIPTGQGSVIVSTDGATWAQQAVPGVDYFNQVVFGNGFFLAIGSSGGSSGFWSSPDGVTWTQCAAPDTSYYNGISIVKGGFLAMGGDGILYQNGPFEQLGNPRSLPNQTLEWTVTGAPQINYRIEFSDDLLNWQTLERVTNAPIAHPFTDPEAATRSSRFYRVVTE